ncbi:MAG: EamA family transporter [Bacteroidia bacterium]|nr:EamA family transporter [Bacteroidia bacterium]MBT8275654.1 EamA family transporter [Bacteroidia bacterium]NNK54297.1 EamA family transporter [Flavobacteriaceae bacterium]NNM08788.1 EamA family transporter [Flavobacteriaceae bacterium]
MGNNKLKWVYLIILSLIWGSSFILIKKGLIGLTDYQLGSLRIVLTSIILFSVGFKSIREIKKKHWIWVAISGFVSSFFPPFLFAIAQNHIDSGITSILNSIVPLNTVIIGALLFAIGVTRRQIWGVLIGLAGTLMLIYGGMMITDGGTIENSLPGETNYLYSGLIILATIGYAFNVNIIKKYLNDISALAVTTGNFIFVFLPSLVILYYSGFFEEIMRSQQMQLASGYVLILALFGTALAKVIFNRLVQIASPVFASSVTYTMPIVAVGWGLVDGESFGFLQLIAAGVILFGVYLSNKRQKLN